MAETATAVVAAPEAPSEFLKVAEVARELNVAKSTVYKQLELGELQYVRVGRARRIPRTALDRFIARNITGGDLGGAVPA